MEGSTFDRFARAVSTTGSRRRLLCLSASVGLGGLLSQLDDEAIEAKRKRRRRHHRRGKRKGGNGGPDGSQCGVTGSVCSQDSDCCSDNCFNFACADKVQTCGSGDSTRQCVTPARGCAGGSCCYGLVACGGTCCQPTVRQCSPQGTCCASNCADRQCGDDGCGGSCGTCGTGENCEGGTCVPAVAGTCRPEDDICTSETGAPTRCNGSPTCYCLGNLNGFPACVDNVQCRGCTSDQSCRDYAQQNPASGLSPTEAICVLDSGPQCLCGSATGGGGFCANPCPASP